MQATLLGTGDVTGLPVPLCDCRYCVGSDRRRRSGLLVETAETTLLFDASPDVREALRETGVDDLDAVFVTHHHTDHAGGIEDLAPALAVTEFDIHMTATARDHFESEVAHLADRLPTARLEHGRAVTVGDCRVVPFPVDHARPAFDTLGFAVHPDGRKLVYAPDMERFLPERPGGEAFVGADLLVMEGSGLVGPNGAGTPETVRENVAAAAADRTVLTHVNEHIAERSTGAFRERARAAGCELGADFERYEV